MSPNLAEEWRPVTGFKIDLSDCYEISNYGNVRSIDRVITRKNGIKYNKKGAVIKQQTIKDGYKRVRLQKDCASITVGVHQLVGFVFLEKCPGTYGCKVGDYCIDHIDKDKGNNSLSNLRWLTVTENVKISHTGNMIRIYTQGEKHSKSKITKDMVVKIRNDFRSLRKIAKEYKLDTSTIHDIIQGRTWKSVPYPNKEEQIKHRYNNVKGVIHANSKLSEADVKSILADTRPQKVIAKEYGVCQQTISKLKRRITFAKIGE